jgi:beta-glucuronosyltransferase
MLEAKPSSPGSSGAAGAAAHIHAHRRWAAPLLASVLLSSLLISASLFFSSSRALLLSFSPLPSAASAEPLFVEAKLRQQMRAEERPARGAVPRIAYLVSGSAGDGAALRRTLRALYHPANTYVVHLDLEAPAAERAELAAAVRADPVYARFRNVKVVTRANLVTYRGPTMVANTLHAAAILLREGGDWDWFINLSASDYPLVTQDGKRRCDLPPSAPQFRDWIYPSREDATFHPIFSVLLKARSLRSGQNQFQVWVTGRWGFEIWRTVFGCECSPNMRSYMWAWSCQLGMG